MSDQIAISNLIIYEYARRIDSGDFDGIGELFKRGKIIFKDSQQITEISGSKEIKELYEKTTRLYDDGTPRTHHATTNITLDIDSNSASTFPTTPFSNNLRIYLFNPSSLVPMKILFSLRTVNGISKSGKSKFL